jgi:hypothetical protein
MSHKIKFMVIGVLLLTGTVALSACGTSNPQAPFDADAQKHAAGWMPQGHRAAVANNGAASCQECHGEDLSGGIAKVSCTACHLGGPLSIHPETWAGNAILTLHGQFVVKNSTDTCANINCHGSNLKGAAGPSCANFTADNRCHISFP